jgi:hypothetical protein
LVEWTRDLAYGEGQRDFGNLPIPGQVLSGENDQDGRAQGSDEVPCIHDGPGAQHLHQRYFARCKRHDH